MEHIEPMSRPRYLPNGDVVFPNRGKPPVIVPGYFQDDKDPWLWHPDFVECNHREQKLLRKPCNQEPVGYRTYTAYWCNHFKKEVNAAFCSRCDYEPKVI